MKSIPTEEFSLTTPAVKKSRMRRGGWSWGPVEGVKLRVGSLGAGIQSTTLVLMAEHGEIGPKPDYWLYAPVGDARATREHLKWLAYSNVTTVPIVELDDPEITLRRAIQNRVEQNGQRGISIPAYLSGKKDGQDRRQCTREFKTDRLTAKQRELMGYKPRQRIPSGSCEVWIDYSTDEVVRAGAAFDPWVVHRFPLIEMRMTIGDCVAWLERHGYPVPPRSKCTFCPYRTNAEWRWLKDNEPDNWVDAVEIDRLIRETPGMRAKSYLHVNRVPLDQVDLSTDEERGQGMLMICEGACGV